MRPRSLPRKLPLFAAAALLAAGGVVLHAQTPAPPKPAAPQQAPAQPVQREVIRRNFDIITTDVIVRDNKSQFIANLKKEDFEVFEDGVKQEVV